VGHVCGFTRRAKHALVGHRHNYFAGTDSWKAIEYISEIGKLLERKIRELKAENKRLHSLVEEAVEIMQTVRDMFDIIKDKRLTVVIKRMTLPSAQKKKSKTKSGEEKIATTTSDEHSVLYTLSTLARNPRV
jgi:cell division protein ZapA (FtsZ GTPase activity inhibitor)